MKLRFPVAAAVFAVLLTVAGVIACGLWWEDFQRGEVAQYSRKTQLFMLLMVLCVVIGPGLLVMVQQRIDLYANRLESRLLGTRKVLDRATLAVLKETSNGYLVRDGRGGKIHVHKLMDRADDLRKLIDKLQQPPSKSAW